MSVKNLSTGIEASATGESLNSGDPAVHPAARHILNQLCKLGGTSAARLLHTFVGQIDHDLDHLVPYIPHVGQTDHDLDHLVPYIPHVGGTDHDLDHLVPYIPHVGRTDHDLLIDHLVPHLKFVRGCAGSA